MVVLGYGENAFPVCCNILAFETIHTGIVLGEKKCPSTYKKLQLAIACAALLSHIFVAPLFGPHIDKIVH
jgi:hypothetical protein